MGAVRRFSEAYGAFIADRTFALIALVVVISAVASYGNSLLENVAMDQKDMLPKEDPVVKDLDFIENEFGGADTALIVVEIDSENTGSDEIRDVRDPRVVEYVDILAQKAGKLEEVTSATSAADILKKDGRLPQSQNAINSALAANMMSSTYVSSDYSMSLVRMALTDDVDEDALAKDLEDIVEETPHPPGVIAKPSGQVAVGNSIKSQIGPDMARTSQFSLIGVLLLVVLTFSSIRYGLISLLAIFLGTVWSFGLMGLIGMSITSATSGGASMIMGIGIDFGIQVVSRFRIESRKSGIRTGMVETMDAVLVPMSTTTLAALIGFRAMSMGQLTILSELASMMSLGVLCCMMAALTIVPGALVLGEKYLKESR